MGFMKTGTPIPFQQVKVCPNCGLVVESDTCHRCGHNVNE